MATSDEAVALVRQLAATSTIVTVDGVVDYECGLCGETFDSGSEPKHAPECLWVRAVAFVLAFDTRD